VGWAVPEELRGQGRAGEAFIAAIKELRHGFAPHGMTAFWVEGIVGADNKSSQRVAEKFISAPVSIDTDRLYGWAGVIGFFL
jgi:RimJ/RimL family protein N-acetyltransferase